MKAYILAGGSENLDSLKLVERPDPHPGPGQLLLRVHATSLNFRDQAVVSGKYFGGRLSRDTVPLSDGAGEVVAMGGDVERFRIGDRVAATFFSNWVEGSPPGPMAARGSPLDGMLSELVVIDEADAVLIPDNLSFEEAATLPCAGVTAWNALMVSSHVTPGQSVLVMGTGGVSIFALQFARAAGARVIATSSSDEKLARAKQLGADTLINYRSTPDWEKEVLNATGGSGVDHVVEVGGAGTLARSFQCVGYRGNIALIGVLAGREGDTNPHPLMFKGASLTGIFVGNRVMFEQMNRAIAVNGIKPVIDRVFPFAEARQAFEHHQSQAHFGKVVIGI